MSDTYTDFEPLIERKTSDFQAHVSLASRLRAMVAPAQTILGVDISHYNGIVDFAALRASNVKGVFIKCSESTNFKDPRFEINWQGARDEGLPVMVYHFFRDKPGADEFSWFMECAQNFLDDVQGNAAVALDVETNNGVTPAVRADRAFDFCARVKAAGLLDGIYCSPSLVTSLFPSGETRWNNLSFQWVAHWTSAPTYTLPAGWSASLVKAWQFGIYPKYSWAPKVDGAGTVDVNWLYFPTEQDLKVWLGQDDGSGYPFPVRVMVQTEIREVADLLAKPLSIALIETGFLVTDATDDVDGALWYFVGSGWIRADHVVEVDTPIILPPIIPPDPINDTAIYTVTADKTLARFIHSYNDAGKPIMQIYPGDSITEGRIRYDTGAAIEVYPEKMRGDGGGDYYQIVNHPVVNPLYLDAADGVLS